MKPTIVAGVALLVVGVGVWSLRSDVSDEPIDGASPKGGETVRPLPATPPVEETDADGGAIPHRKGSESYRTLKEMADARGLILVGSGDAATPEPMTALHETTVALYGGDNQTVIDVLKDLDQSDPDVRSEALDALLPLDLVCSEGLEPLLIHYLRRDPDASVRCAAARALEDGEAPQTIDALIDALGDEADAVRETARGALGMIRGPVVRYKLKERLTESDPGMRETVIQILEDVFNEPLVLDE